MLLRLNGHDEISTTECEETRNQLLHLRIHDISVSPIELKHHYSIDEIVLKVTVCMEQERPLKIAFEN